MYQQSTVPTSAHRDKQARYFQQVQAWDAQTIHGGFGSRYSETCYNKAMFALVFLFQNTLLKFFDGGK